MPESRKVIKIHNSFFVGLPSVICEELKIGKGDRCKFLLLPGFGLLVQKEGDGQREPIPLEGLANLHEEADQIFHETRRKIRGLQNQAIDIIWMRLTGLLFKHGPAVLYPPSPNYKKPQDLIMCPREKPGK